MGFGDDGEKGDEKRRAVKEKELERRRQVGSKQKTVSRKHKNGGFMSNHRGYRDLKVYQLSYMLAMELFRETKKFPPEEKYSLTDQVRRASRSIPTNIAEAWKKRRYAKAFVSKISDSYGEGGEVEVLLDLSLDCGYIPKERHSYYRPKYDEVNKMLHSMIEHPERFCITLKP